MDKLPDNVKRCADQLIRHLLIAAIVMVGMSATAFANLIVNGGFETPSAPLSSSEASPTGWDVTVGQGVLLDYARGATYYSPGPSEGSQYYYIGSGGQRANLQQTVLLTAGDLYLLAFDLSPLTGSFWASLGYNTEVDLTITNGAETFLPGFTYDYFIAAEVQDWVTQGYWFSPTMTGEYTITFTTRGGQDGGTQDAACIDNVILTDVSDTLFLVSPSNDTQDISTSLMLDWSDVEGAAGYDVQVCTDSSCNAVVRSNSSTSSEWKVSPALDEGTTYYWQVRAKNAYGYGSFTSPWRFMPTAIHNISVITGLNGIMSCDPNPVNDGESSTCTVTPTVGYSVDMFTVDGIPVTLPGNTYVFNNATAGHTVNVTFKINTYAITATAGANGTISCSPNPINHGESATCTVIPAVGYRVDAFTVDESLVTLMNNQYVFTNVTAAHTANVSFTILTYPITARSGQNGTISCSPNPVAYGGSSTCTITPAAGYSVNSFTIDGSATMLPGSQYILNTVIADHLVNVTFHPTPRVTVKASTSTAKEAGATAGNYRIIQTGDATDPLTVYFTMSGTGTSVSDYTMPSYLSATIPAGAKYVDVILTATDDLLYDPKETVVLTLLPNSTYAVGSTTNATITITDNDPTVTVKASPSKAKEAASVPGKFRITRKGDTTKDLTVHYALSGMAAAGTDYSAPSYESATIPAGSRYVDVILTPFDDLLYDPGETAILSLLSDPAYGLGTTAVATITITDNDPTLTVKASPVIATESGATLGKFRITRKGDTTRDLAVSYAISGTATTGIDYIMPSYDSVTIPAGAKYVDVVLTAIDDDVYDPGETAVLTLSSNPAYGFGKTTAATITITDNDPEPLAAAMATGAMVPQQEDTTAVVQRYDFNGDGKPDILWQKNTGELRIWYMNENTQTAQVATDPPSAGPCWKLAGVADFNSDGKPDILLQQQCGEHWPLAIWYMDNSRRISEAQLEPATDIAAGWKALEVEDFDGDKHPDVLLQRQTGEVWPIQIRYTANETRIGTADVWSIAGSPHSAGAAVAGVEDFNGDGKPDILFQDQSAEKVSLRLWIMDGEKQTSEGQIESAQPLDPVNKWTVGEVADFNSDGKPDILWQSEQGLLYLWHLDGNVVKGTSLTMPSATSPEWRVMAK
jgi:hypothetical protein